MTAEYPVDFVVLWVNGNDPAFVRERNRWADSPVVPARFVQTDELRYVLRSVEEYMPWVTRVVLVTNGQVPKWLNVNHPRLKILTHAEFMPASALPTFNSCAIEMSVTKWGGLSEHFLLANDDTFAFRPVSREYFFPRQNRVNNYYAFYPYKKYEDTAYGRQLLIIRERLNNFFPGLHFPLKPTHNISAYLKNSLALGWTLFEKELSATVHSRFRQDSNMNFYLFACMAAVQGLGCWKKRRLSRLGCSDECCWELYQNFEREINKYRPRLVCLNDSENCGPQDRAKLTTYLQKAFPLASRFEKS
ncbi:stealth family protein [Candidatus Avelusimicrobium fimicolum]|uniref:stealth family protein n=1 Tax=Candidatus Avelusimicrobium fimicolum TaxID=3416216 RepID=UPI003D0F3FBC